MNLLLITTSVKPDNSLGFTLTVVIAGLGIVLIVLALLIVVFNIFGKIMYASQKKKEQKSVTTNDERQYPDISEMKVEEPPLMTDGGAIGAEIIAAISAAVYEIEGGDAKITSIKPSKKRQSADRGTRKIWAQSAVDYNTRPF